MSARIGTVVAALVMLAAGASAEQPPRPPDPLPGVTVLPILQPGEGERIADLWRAQTTLDDQGRRIPAQSTVPAESLVLDGRPVLKLTCNFKDTTIPRTYWDRAVELNLTRVTAVCFDVYARNVGAISSVNLYLRSGEGWYGARWYPQEENQWCRIRLPLGEFYVDHPGGGWADIDTIRFSPWMGVHEDAELYIANLGVEESPVPAALVRANYHDRNGRPVDAGRWVETVGSLLDAAGCALATMSTSDLSAERLADLKLLVLPYASGMPDEEAGVIADFVRGGGKLIACYSLPGPLAELLGVRQKGYRTGRPRSEFSSMRFVGEPPHGAPAEVKQGSWGIIDSEAVDGVGRVAAWWHDAEGNRTDAPAIIISADGAWISHVLLDDDPVAKGRLLVALMDHFAPGTATHVARRRIAQMGQRLQVEDWQHAVALTRAQPAFADASADLVEQAEATRRRAQDTDDPFEAMTLADRAERLLEEAFCRAQQSVEKEFRATWCHPPAGIAGWGWPRTADRLKEAGIRHLFLNALHGASAAYPSEVLPFDKENPDGVDYLQQAVDACSARGIKVHVWMTNFKARGHAPADLVEQLENEGRFAVRVDGTRTDTLCPSDPRNQDLQIRAMIEAAHRPGVAGIHFDYIRYPGGDTCFCDGCRRRFETWAETKVNDWPADVLRGGTLRDKWLEFRRSNITRVVREVSQTVRREVPDCMISAAVFRNYPQCADDVGQDWVAWAQAGYLDFVCPMNYTASHTQFRKETTAQLRYLKGVVPCYPGIGLLTGLGPVGAVRQVQIARELGCGGFVIWSVFPAYIDDVYPYLGMSLLR
ncbi:MAG: family 10 glycosylhydrolase [Armatimonadetes bacterium]|nr:family 10 glycosylhydrolase [Armatimonadota bacterium]